MTRILVTGPDRRSRTVWSLTALAVRRAGGRAVRWTPRRQANGEAMPADIDGVLLGGGDDIDPQRYRQEAGADARLSPERDELEWSVLAAAWQRGLPVLGICRGAQLLNVYLGGTLHQDLRVLYPQHNPRKQLLAQKRISVARGSALERAMGDDAPLFVNSLHRQGVWEVGEGLWISAHDQEGVPQAVEHRSRPILGVQWHPELLPHHRRQQRLFRWLAKEAAARSASQEPRSHLARQ